MIVNSGPGSIWIWLINPQREDSRVGGPQHLLDTLIPTELSLQSQWRITEDISHSQTQGLGLPQDATDQGSWPP